jgi:hypothetical protein
MSASERCYFSPLAVGVTIACVIPDKKMKKEKFFEKTPKIKIGGLNIQSYERIPIYKRPVDTLLYALIFSRPVWKNDEISLAI